ncbi:MAG TPA: cache domain-containing protein [Herbaspirillum sp.]|jgi:two-component system NarL family sensor kinase
MKLRQKIILLAITPLIVALCAIVFAVHYQANILAKQYRATVEAAYLASKKEELHHYVTLATHSIAHLYESGKNDPETLAAAREILSKLDYGEDDGYIFVYDQQGTSLMHPRQPDLVGRDLFNMEIDGSVPIQRLLARARAGGGFESYLWEKPPTGKVTPKLGYVVPLERWGWMLGAALYLDDVDVALAKMDSQISGNIDTTMLWITGIAIAASLIITLAGLAFNVSEFRVADAKLKALAQRVVRSQEDERARLSRDLHDGISQLLVSVKLQIESGIVKLANIVSPEASAAANASFGRAAVQLNNALGEVRRISHDLRPALLDDLGLAAALAHLTHEFAEITAVTDEFESNGTTEHLSDVSKTVLFRIAQEALTNVKRHAFATAVKVSLISSENTVTLTIADNGRGFDIAGVAQNPKHGIGLRNMHERLESIGGKLDVFSSADGTSVVATIANT